MLGLANAIAAAAAAAGDDKYSTCVAAAPYSDQLLSYINGSDHAECTRKLTYWG